MSSVVFRPGSVMPITLLWAVDVYGRVYSLSTAGQRWERCDDMLLELKRVSAGKGRCWGIGCDHHVYLNMMPSETSIRYKEETYENQVGPRCVLSNAQHRFVIGADMLLLFLAPRGGTRWTASPTPCCPPTAGRGAT